MNKIDKESYQKILEILANKNSDDVVEKAIAKFLKEEKKQEENVDLTKQLRRKMDKKTDFTFIEVWEEVTSDEPDPKENEK